MLYIAMRLDEVLQKLEKNQVTSEIIYTKPVSSKFAVCEDELYIVRQRTLQNGKLQLTVAAKMRREVSKYGL